MISAQAAPADAKTRGAGSLRRIRHALGAAALAGRRPGAVRRLPAGRRLAAGRGRAGAAGGGPGRAGPAGVVLLRAGVRPGLVRPAALLAGQRGLVRVGRAGGRVAVIFAVLALGQRLLLRLPLLAGGGGWLVGGGRRRPGPVAVVRFPWGRLAMSQSVAPDVRWVAIGGVPLLSFLVALTGAMLAWAVLVAWAPAGGLAGRRRHRPLAAAGGGGGGDGGAGAGGRAAAGGPDRGRADGSGGRDPGGRAAGQEPAPATERQRWSRRTTSPPRPSWPRGSRRASSPRRTW